MEDRSLTKHYFISGRVQGVGFRAFTQRLAAQLKLIGWVRNLNDGRVEVVVRGNSSQLEAFDKQVRQGPSFGNVDRVDVQDGPAGALAKIFEIRKNGGAE